MSLASKSHGPTESSADHATPARTLTLQRPGPEVAKDWRTLARSAGNRAIQTALGEGAPLPPGARAPIEALVGADLAAVRVHTDTDAADASRALGAEAFTVGRHIFFGAGRFAPGTPMGDRLLRHEAAHTVQQGLGEAPSGSAPVPVVDSPEHEAHADRVSDGVRGRGSARPPAISGVQRQQAPATPAPPTPAAAAAPPVLFGFDMSTQPPTPYVSVTLPGHALAEVATYLFGDADSADTLRALNAGLPEQLPPGQPLHFDRTRLAPAAAAAFNDAINTGQIMRTNGMPQGGGAPGQPYLAMIGGQAVPVTEEQYVGLLRGRARKIAAAVAMLKNTAEASLEALQDHREGSNRFVRWVSDEVGGVTLPDESVFTGPIQAANQLIDQIDSMEITPDSEPDIQALLPAVDNVADQVHAAEARWHAYLEGTIAGAGSTAHGLEVVRNTSFAVEAGLAGAVAAPAVFAVAGTGLGAIGITGTTAAVLSTGAALGGAAVAGGTTRGLLDVAAPGAQTGQPAWDRFTHGFRTGSVQGALGGAGALAAPAVSAAISTRVFGVAPELLTGASRVGLNVMTGAAIGAPTGAVSTGIDQLDALRSGDISFGQYMERVGFGGLTGAGMGGAFSVLPIQGLYRTGGMRLNPFSGETVTPLWMFAAPGAPRIQPVQAPAAFHALPEPRVPLPEGYSWMRINNRWVTMRGANVPEQPLRLVSYGPDPAGRFNYHLLSQGRLLGSSSITRPVGNTFPQSARVDVFADPDAFVEMTPSGPSTRFDEGHITDHADTAEGPGVTSSTADPENFLPEASWWNQRVRSPLVARIRRLGGGYRELAYYNTTNPRFTTNGTPIPEGVFFVQTDAARVPIDAWNIPFSYSYAGGPTGLRALPQFRIPLTSLPPILQGTAPSPVLGVGGGAASEVQR